MQLSLHTAQASTKAYYVTQQPKLQSEQDRAKSDDFPFSIFS
ncbi:hypothetical protein [Xenorhabdus bovienii]|nr:hypothetical protein [Xenorhabdus bovienii]CDG87321.1 hypothetical protein XBFFR1_1730005 [Xenorhabdus bovienii str. feltiae France]CDG94010.1 hypothetical protein XBFFL1_300005 [Xenorhabdus bovienii str. feltiae Florida]